jgi:signal transduction histidine kinase
MAMRSGYPVIIAMVLVVTSFAVSLGYSQYLVHQIDESALSIIQQSVPRFGHLAAARRALLELQEAMLTEEQLATAPREDERAQIYAYMEQVRTELAAYNAESPQEAAQIAEALRDIGQLEAHTRRSLERIDAASSAVGLVDLARSTLPLELRISGAFEHLRNLNVERVNSDTRRILGLHRSGAKAAAALGLLSVVLAIAATALVVQVQRARARLIAAHERFMTERAAELECFAGRVAHDLRDPLNAAGMRLAVLEQSRDLDATERSQVAKVGGQLGRMRRVIDGLLEFARSGARPVPGAEASLVGALEEVLTSARPAAEAAHIELRIEPITDVPLAVAPEALSSVLSNLLGNAVKYVGEGRELPHRVAVRVSRSAGLARIEVEDNGPGVPPGSEERIFEPFRRLPSQQPGTGLGLATVKRIVEAYHGRLGVVTDPGHGSTFWVEIPCSERQPEPLREPARQG